MEDIFVLDGVGDFVFFFVMGSCGWRMDLLEFMFLMFWDGDEGEFVGWQGIFFSGLIDDVDGL